MESSAKDGSLAGAVTDAPVLCRSLLHGWIVEIGFFEVNYYVVY